MATTVYKNVANEAIIWGRHLTGRTPNAEEILRFKQSIYAAEIKMTSKEKKLLNLCHRYPFLAGSIDGGLAFTNPTSSLRRRIYIMFAVLETSPHSSDYFLPKKRSPLFLLVMGFVGFVAVLKSVVGVLIVKGIRK